MFGKNKTKQQNKAKQKKTKQKKTKKTILQFMHIFACDNLFAQIKREGKQ